ncbi:MAG: glycosyltransferase [Deltaproteobacteria bacterium]
MIRIAYIVDHLQIGGAQRHLLRVVDGLDKQVYAPEIWTAAADAGELAPVFEAHGVQVRSFGIRRSLMRPATWGRICKVAREFRARDIQIVHGYLFEGNFLAALTGLLARTPVRFVAKRSLDRYTRRDRRLAAALSNRLADRVLVNAESVLELVAEHEWCPRERLLCIPNGVELPASTMRPPFDPEHPRIGMVGRLGWKKGYGYALEAFALLRQRIPGLRVEIVGDGNLRDELAERRDALGLKDCVSFLGRRDDVPRLLPEWDIYLLSSIIEGMPNALLEAMAAGMPVVTTDAGGCAEIVEDGVSGLLVAKADATVLADALERICRDPALAARLATAGAIRVRKYYSLEAMISAMDNAYRDALSRAGFKIPARKTEDNPDTPAAGRPSLEAVSGEEI